MPIPDPDLRWVVAFWLVIGVSLIVTLWAAVVLVSDLLRGGFSHADVDPPVVVRQPRPRLAASHRSADANGVSRVRALPDTHPRLDPVDPAPS